MNIPFILEKALSLYAEKEAVVCSKKRFTYRQLADRIFRLAHFLKAMGIDKVRTKLTAFALGATWAGMAGVIFAANTTFINPASFTFLESAMILSIVVLGGMGSIAGVILGAVVLILLPEYLRAFSEYRMLLFGAIMVLMMVFRPQGLISNVRRTYELKSEVR